MSNKKSKVGNELTRDDVAFLNALARKIGTDKIRIMLDVIDQNTGNAFRSVSRESDDTPGE